MILIKDYDFEMEQVKSAPFFDLSILSPVNEGKENERYEMKLAGYGMTFEHCMKTMIIHRLSQLEEVFSVAEYVQRYAEEVKKFASNMKITSIQKATVKEENDGDN
jgi:hypothetical protein